MRTLRKLLDVGLPILGILVVLGAVLFVIQLRVQIALVVLGLLIIEAGVWNVHHPLLPNERKYRALRSEADRFMGLVRRLNDAALEREEHDSAAAREAVDDAERAMHRSVERMVEVAGKTDVEVAAARKPWA